MLAENPAHQHDFDSIWVFQLYIAQDYERHVQGKLLGSCKVPQCTTDVIHSQTLRSKRKLEDHHKSVTISTAARTRNIQKIEPAYDWSELPVEDDGYPSTGERGDGEVGPAPDTDEVVVWGSHEFGSSDASGSSTLPDRMTGTGEANGVRLDDARLIGRTRIRPIGRIHRRSQAVDRTAPDLWRDKIALSSSASFHHRPKSSTRMFWATKE